MLQAFVLPAKENRAIQNELKTVYIKTDYICFINELLFYFRNYNNDNVPKLADNMFYVMNKLLLDNLFKYIASKNYDAFFNVINNKVFTKDLHINHFYINQLLEGLSVYIEDQHDAESYLIKRTAIYLDEIYTNNVESFNHSLFDMYEVMFRNLQHKDFSYYKFELMNQLQPILLFSEKQNENYLHF